MAGIVESGIAAPPPAATRDDYIAYVEAGGTLSQAAWVKAGKPKA